MSGSASVWQRLGSILRGSTIGGNGNSNRSDPARSPAAAPTSAGSTPVGPAAAASVPVAPLPAEESRSRLLPWRREPTLPQLRAGQQRLIELMDVLQEHFRRQDERNAQLGQSVERMVGILEQLSQTAGTQQEHIRSVAEQVREAGQHTAAMSESLAQVPRSLQVQADAVRSMLRQIEISQESDTQLMHSLEQLGRAVDALSTSSAAQVQTLERLDQAERAQREALTTLVREQTRRFVLVIAVAAVLGLGAIVTLTLLVLRAGG